MFKKLYEERTTLVEKMNQIVTSAESEERAMTDSEKTEFDEAESQINKIDATIAAEKKAKELRMEQNGKPEASKEEEEKEKKEERAFENYLRDIIEERTDVNLTKTDNGAVIPESIAKKIIEKVKDISPLYEMTEKFHVGGTLTFPIYDEETQRITMAYAEEFKALTSTSGKFKSASLKGFLAGALTKISNSLINNSSFAIVPYVITKMSESIADWIEKELISGTDEKIEGLRGVEQIVTCESAIAITTDELIDVQEEVLDKLQAGAIWIMNRKTRKAIRKLKDADGNYLLNKDMTAKWGYTLLGHDVYTTDNMPEMAAGNKVIYYGDMSALKVKIAEDVNIQVLREKYADEHATGVIAWIEMDAKVFEKQKISCLKMKSS